MTFSRPIERPMRQVSSYIFVENQSDGEAVALIDRSAISLFGCDVAGSAEFLDGFHLSFNFHRDAEVTESSSFVGEEEDVIWINIAMCGPVSVCVSEAVKDLSYDRDDPFW